MMLAVQQIYTQQSKPFQNNLSLLKLFTLIQITIQFLDLILIKNPTVAPILRHQLNYKVKLNQEPSVIKKLQEMLQQIYGMHLLQILGIIMKKLE